MSRHTKDKKKKQKQIEKRLEKVEQQQIEFDIIMLLKTELLDTKPNFAKFLKEYVKDIRCYNSQKIQFYPIYKYELSKVFVKFLDGHELIYDIHALTDQSKYCMLKNIDEEQIKEKDILVVKKFFDLLFQFKFVY